MLSRSYPPDAYTLASIINTYKCVPNGKLDTALAADLVVHCMESIHLHDWINKLRGNLHYTMVCT